jgi:GH25 family lysozyme M1 (1,4-beta-N-acetylmuramidase)
MPGTEQGAAAAHVVHSAQGEDRSDWQSIGPWTAENTFGFAKATEGLGWTDPTFEANWRALKQERKFRGAYHFFNPAESGAAQADFFLNYVLGHGGLVPGDMLVVDSEVWADSDGSLVVGGQVADGPVSYMSRPAKPLVGSLADPKIVGDSTLAFLRQVDQQLGKNKDQHPVLVYTNLSVAQQLADCIYHELWIAYPALDAPPSVAPWNTWRFWQWEFGGGPGGGDRDAYNGTLEELTEWIDSFRNAPIPKD